MRHHLQYILIDMYGVIMEEGKGYFIPYTAEEKLISSAADLLFVQRGNRSIWFGKNCKV